jgi:predicted ATPase
LRIKGVVAEAAGQVDRGADLCRRAAALARRQGALSFELRAATTLGQMRASHPHEALELLDSVYGRFVEGFDTPDLLKAKRLIDELKMSSNRPDFQYSI